MGTNAPKTWINYLQMFGDVLILNAAVALAFTIRHDWIYFLANTELHVVALIAFSVLMLLFFNLYGLYNTANKDWTDILSAVFVSLIFLSLGVAAITYMIPSYIFPRRVLFTFGLLYGPAVALWRWLLLMIEHRITPAQKVIIVANPEEIPSLASKLNGNHILLGAITAQSFREAAYPNLGSAAEAEAIFTTYQPDIVLISGNLPEEIKSQIVLLGMTFPCILYVVPNLYEIMVGQAVLDQFQDTPVYQIRLTRNPGQTQIKRLFDCLIAVTMLIITLPLTILAALAVKLTSPGPIFYTQERVGRDNRRFMLYKFRTMVKNAEAATGPVLAKRHDSRVTKVGRFLRATRIDELPQLINVLKGEMSIVGPRPERPVFVERYNKEVPGYTYRHTMDAGITGLAQVSGKYSTSPQDKLRYDLLYAKGASPLFDLRIMLQTLKVMLLKDKAS
ncbi:MAG TPA: sugar transferase [Oscillospiraceae bacterium]|nr:sugar transferase [Oscillospiraceae bacterium]